jgi:hypothetical protein
MTPTATPTVPASLLARLDEYRDVLTPEDYGKWGGLDEWQADVDAARSSLLRA